MGYLAFAPFNPTSQSSAGRFDTAVRRTPSFSPLSARSIYPMHMIPSSLELSFVEGDPVQPTGVYEAVLPPAETLVGMGLVVALCIACAWYWNEKVVPVSRTNLAISKSRGDVKEYLDELRATDPSLAVMTNTTSLSGEANAPLENEERNVVAAPSQSIDRAFERWLFTDWLENNKSERKAGRQKEPALPILKDAKWNSGDNPVVVAAALMVIGLTVTALTERVTAWL